MGFDHNHNHHLNLGLGIAAAKSNNKPTTMTSTSTVFEPSLTLALSSGIDSGGDHHVGASPYGRQASPQSAVSSFSGAVKRERDDGDDDGDGAEKAASNSRVSDEDEDGSNARKKLRLTKEQSALLEESFKLHSTLNPKQKQALARQLSLRPRQVEVWFQNRRARTKLKQTEVDCEFLKKCCETLTEENRRLQKELQELKALKLSQPLYMHMPAATLSMCPSCERIGSVAGTTAGGDISAGPKSQHSMAHQKQHFYNPFTNPSAAC